MNQNIKNAIIELIRKNPKSRLELSMAKRVVAKKYSIPMLLNSDVIQIYNGLVASKKIKADQRFEGLIRKRSVRTMSGIAPVAVLTKPHPCPGVCVYCPTEKDVPQSYLSNEPAVMRAIRSKYDPFKQVQDRLRALEANGHEPTKIELIVIGGTWSVLPRKYKYWYIVNLFAAANHYSSPLRRGRCRRGSVTGTRLSTSPYTLSFVRRGKNVNDLKERLYTEQKKNERAKYKIVGLTLETRPDYIDEKEILEMRELGCTRMELGVQAVDDRILKLNKRGHGVWETARATRLLKDAGFKVTYHFMPGLPGSTPARDFKMFQDLFIKSDYQPDQIKFYPTVVTRGSLLYRWWKQGKYKPYTAKQLEKLIIKCKAIVPKYVRIIRLIRDIPGESIEAGNKVTNLRQVMRDAGVKCHCIRCREVKDGAQSSSTLRGGGLPDVPSVAGGCRRGSTSEPRIQNKLNIKDLKLNIQKYKASGGDELFISFDSKDGKTLYGFCRLRFASHNVERVTRNAVSVFQNSALIRELHVYGELVSVGSVKKVQHAGLGKRLMQEAEKQARLAGYKKITVISGIGVRGYYRKLGYRLKDTYMIKWI